MSKNIAKKETVLLKKELLSLIKNKEPLIVNAILPKIEKIKSE